MRSEDSADVEDVCNDPLVQTACLMGSDKCPAACQEKEDNTTDDKEEVVVKSGDLAVKVSANEGADAFLYGGISDLDTIKFNASEENVEVTKVTLERYGYSSSADVKSVWLEDENGNKIADEKELNSKDQVTLTIKKNYRNLESSDSMTIVLKTAEEYDPDVNPGSKIGFKVVSIESSAENVNISKYTPNTYDLVSYNGSDVVMSYKGKEQTYHMGESSYEVFRTKIKASSTSAALVKGFTITNTASNDKLDLEDFVSDVIVTVNDEKVEGLSYKVDDDEITVAFDEVEIAVKESAIFALNIVLSDDFDELGSKVLFKIDESGDLKANEKKTGARVNLIGYNTTSDATYTFNGGKVSLSNTKLSTINAAAGSDDVIIAEGTIDLGGQALEIAADTISIKATNNKTSLTAGAGIEELRLVIAGEEFDAKCSDSANTTTCAFNKKMTWEKGGKAKLIVDLDDEDSLKDTTITFTVNSTDKSVLSKSTIGTAGDPAYVKGFTYEESDGKVYAADFVGSITLYDLKVTAAKASMENKLTKSVEFKLNETTTQTVFEGEYTAKKQDVTLTDVNYKVNNKLADADDSVTLNLYVNDKLVASTDIDSSDNVNAIINDTLTRTTIAAEKTVKVRVEAEVYAAHEGTYSYEVELIGEDSDGVVSGRASDSTVDMKFVTAGSVTVSSISSKANTVLERASNVELANFVVKASNGTVDLDEIEFSLAKLDPVNAEYYEWVAQVGTAQVGTAQVGTAQVGTPASSDYEAAHCDDNIEKSESECGTEHWIAQVGTPASSDYVPASDDYVPASDDYAPASSDYVAAHCEDNSSKNQSDCIKTVKTPASTDTTDLNNTNVRVRINKKSIDEDDIVMSGTNILIKNIDENDIDENGIEVIISYKGLPVAGEYLTSLVSVNGTTKSTTFKKNVVAAVLTIDQDDLKGSTEYTFKVSSYESDNTISNVQFFKDGERLGGISTEISDGDTLEIEGNTSGVQLIDEITYHVNGTNGGDVVIKKSDYNDFFKVGGSYLKVFKAD